MSSFSAGCPGFDLVSNQNVGCPLFALFAKRSPELAEGLGAMQHAARRFSLRPNLIMSGISTAVRRGTLPRHFPQNLLDMQRGAIHVRKIRIVLVE